MFEWDILYKKDTWFSFEPIPLGWKYQDMWYTIKTNAISVGTKNWYLIIVYIYLYVYYLLNIDCDFSKTASRWKLAKLKIRTLFLFQ